MTWLRGQEHWLSFLKTQVRFPAAHNCLSLQFQGFWHPHRDIQAGQTPVDTKISPKKTNIGRNVEAGTKAEARRKSAYQLVRHGLLKLLSYIPGEVG